MRVTAIIIGILAALALVGYYVYTGLTLEGPAMPGQGYLALTLGVVFALLVGFGLMALLFFSSRRGYDEPPRYE